MAAGAGASPNTPEILAQLVNRRRKCLARGPLLKRAGKLALHQSVHTDTQVLGPPFVSLASLLVRGRPPGGGGIYFAAARVSDSRGAEPHVTASSKVMPLRLSRE